MSRMLGDVLTIVRSSVARRGVLSTLARAGKAPGVLWRHLVESRRRRPTPVSDFDRRFGVDTDGALDGTTSLRDLDIPDPGWILGSDYIAVSVVKFHRALSSLTIPPGEFTFVDLGCGKGRAVMLASDYPFRRLVGIDFSPELIATARRNWSRYRSPVQRCRDAEFICENFVAYPIPLSPVILYLYHPCQDVVLAKVVEHVAQSLAAVPRPLGVVYINPRFPGAWEAMGLSLIKVDAEFDYRIYGNTQLRHLLAR